MSARPYRDLSAFFTGANTLAVRQRAELARFNTEAAAWLEASK